MGISALRKDSDLDIGLFLTKTFSIVITLCAMDRVAWLLSDLATKMCLSRFWITMIRTIINHNNINRRVADALHRANAIR